MNNPCTVLHYPDWRNGNFYQENLQRGLEAAGVTVHFARDTGALFPFTRNLLSRQADVLHLHWISAATGVAQPSFVKLLLHQLIFYCDVLVVKFVLRKKIVWTLHNLFTHDCPFPAADKRNRIWLGKQADAIIAHSHSAKADAVSALHTNPSKLSIIAHGNYLNNYPNHISRKAAREKLNISTESFVYLQFGSARPYKGNEELIQAFRSNNIPNSELIIAGNPINMDYAQTLRKLAGGNHRIHLHLHSISNHDIQCFLNAADVCVFPFRNILTSGSLILALGFGKAVVAPSIGSIKDYLPNGGGILYNPDERDALTHALREIIRMDTQTAGQANQRFAESLNWNEIAKQTAEVYSS